jgi:hypothetical protein
MAANVTDRVWSLEELMERTTTRGRSSMSTRTSFDDWLSENDVEEPEEIYALYEAVTNREGDISFEVTTVGEKTFIKGHASNLLLATEKARKAFARRVDQLKGDDTLDMESWIGLQRNLANPKA